MPIIILKYLKNRNLKTVNLTFLDRNQIFFN